MSNLRKNSLKLTCVCLSASLLSACGSLVPDNYLSQSTIQTPQLINGKRCYPTVIPISPEMINTSLGQTLLKPSLNPEPYRVGPYDSLNIIVWGHPEMSTTPSAPAVSTVAASIPSNTSNPTMLVDTDGKIFFPFVGHLKVSGLTINQIQHIITKRLSAYLKDPQVTIQVDKYRNRSIYVLGEVLHPGMQAITDKPLSLMEAISMAGNINPASADPSHIYLVRGSIEHPIVFWLNAKSPQALMIAEQFPLQENDIVFISAASLTGVNRFLNEILPSLTMFVIAKGLS